MDGTRHKRRAIFTSLLKRELFLLSVNPAVYVSGLFFVLCVYYGFFFIHRFFIPGEGSSDLRNFFSRTDNAYARKRRRFYFVRTA